MFNRIASAAAVPFVVLSAITFATQDTCAGSGFFCDSEGKPFSQKVMQVMVRRVARRANVRPGLHILRHSFCSHLAMRGASARAIQELAGHQDLGTTQRYMHLSPAALDAAIRLLETGTEMPRAVVEK
jgi:site-specific recombinase XerD